MTTKKCKFYTVNGWLSDYALSCGYIEKKDKGDNRKTLEKSTIYHVKYTINGVFLWETFESIVQARKFYKSITL